MTRRQQLADIAFMLFLGAVVVGVVVRSLEWPTGSRLFPLVLGVLMGSLLLVQLTVSVRKLQRGDAVEGDAARAWPGVELTVARLRALRTVGTVVGFAVLVWLLGFPIGGPVGLALYLLVIARERLLISAVLIVGSIAFLWAMSVLLRIPFPQPALPFLSNPF